MANAPLEAIRSFLVMVDGSDGAANALASTCEVARRTHASVAALHVIEVPLTLPVDAELSHDLEAGEAALADAEKIASRHDIELDGRILQARQAGAAIVDEASALGVDAIVIGLNYHRQHGRFELGAMPLYVMENARCQVWLLRYPPSRDALKLDH